MAKHIRKIRRIKEEISQPLTWDNCKSGQKIMGPYQNDRDFLIEVIDIEYNPIDNGNKYINYELLAALPGRKYDRKGRIEIRKDEDRLMMIVSSKEANKYMKLWGA